jgi:hypothetical protein
MRFGVDLPGPNNCAARKIADLMNKTKISVTCALGGSWKPIPEKDDFREDVLTRDVKGGSGDF